MRSILRENNNFQEFSKCCQKQSQIKKELDDPEITEERRNELKRHLSHIEEEISRLTIILRDEIKVL